MDKLEQEFARARKLHENDLVRDAIVVYRSILDRTPGNTECLHFLGVALAQIGRQKEAIEILTEASQVTPQNSQIFSNLGEALRQANRVEDAVKAFKNAIEIDESNFDANLSLANIMGVNNELKEAIKLSHKAVELRPLNATALVCYGDFLQRANDTNGAMAAVQKALTILPNYEKALNLYGLLLTKQDKHEEALAAFEEGVRSSPLSAVISQNLASTLVKLGRYSEAEKVYKKLIQLTRDNVSPYIGLGQLYRLQGKYLASEQQLLDGLKVFPRMRPLHYELGLTLISLKRFGDAEKSSRKSRERSKGFTHRKYILWKNYYYSWEN